MIYTYPNITIDLMTYKNNDTCYKDRLCTFINKTIKKVIVNGENTIELIFNGNNYIHLSLQEKDTKGYEAAMLSDGTNFIVW